MDFAKVQIELFGPGKSSHGPIHPQGRVTGACYMPHFRVDGKGEYLGVAFLDGPAVVRPGETAVSEVVLMYDRVDYSALKVGANFEIVEGATPIGRRAILQRWTTPQPWSGASSA